VYDYVNGAWVQKGIDIDGEAANDFSGVSVSLSSLGSVVAISATQYSGGGVYLGQVRVYEYVNGAWVQKGPDIDGEAANDYLGVSVSLSSDGGIVAIGAYGNVANGADSGHVRV
jgi:hypothetical protein